MSAAIESGFKSPFRDPNPFLSQKTSLYFSTSIVAHLEGDTFFYAPRRVGKKVRIIGDGAVEPWVH
ncbi:MAG: hypothetical protein QF745_04745, partial [Planctomycetota bacterium]|nr:hypothetical protein [Planctomycetota bacterium]